MVWLVAVLRQTNKANLHCCTLPHINCGVKTSPEYKVKAVGHLAITGLEKAGGSTESERAHAFLRRHIVQKTKSMQAY